MKTRRAASGISIGEPKGQYHAEKAVTLAMERAELSQATGLILFLSDDHLADIDLTLRAAARISSTTQVFGCTAMGVFTEEEWVIDGSGAAALVLGNGLGLGLPSAPDPEGLPTLSLATPRGISQDWLGAPPRRLGAVASDRAGEGPCVVWTSGRSSPQDRAECQVEGANGRVLVCQGVRPLTSPLAITETSGFNLVRLEGVPALDVLTESLPSEWESMERLPLHMLMCGTVLGDPKAAMEEGRFRLEHILAVNPEDHSVTVTEKFHRGEHLFWAVRDSASAELEMQRTLARIEDEQRPDFALMFSCLGRGPGFFGGEDRDVAILRQRFPDLPFAGFYGNGEIAPLDEASYLYSYSAAIGLFFRSAQDR